MPNKPRDMQHCDIPNCPSPDHRSLGHHMRNYHSKTPSPSEPGISQSPTPGSDTIPFKDIGKSMDKAGKTFDKKAGVAVIDTSKIPKGGGRVLGIGGFFMTLASWLNETVCKDPKVIMTEKIAADLELQFNQAFGVYVQPIVGFVMSTFFIFGVPVLLNLFGKEIISKMTKKFTEGFKKKIDGMGDKKNEQPAIS